MCLVCWKKEIIFRSTLHADLMISTCHCPHDIYMSLSSWFLHVTVLIISTCHCPHDIFMSLSSWYLNVTVLMISTCHCSHNTYMSLFSRCVIVASVVCAAWCEAPASVGPRHSASEHLPSVETGDCDHGGVETVTTGVLQPAVTQVLWIEDYLSKNDVYVSCDL